MKQFFLTALVGITFTLTAQADEYRCLSGDEKNQVKAAVQLALSEFSQAQKKCRVLSNLLSPHLVNSTYQGNIAAEHVTETLSYGNTNICVNSNGQPIIQISEANNVYMITSSEDQRSIVSIDLNRIRRITVNNGTLVSPIMTGVWQVYAQTKCE